MNDKSESFIKLVQLDSLVLMKLTKHCQDCGITSSDPVQGVLLGMVDGNKLEITNCFPMPKISEDEDFDEMKYQMEMIRKLRYVNVDHFHVGWYQSNLYGTYLNKAIMDSQYGYQNAIEESIVLIYDPLKTSKGNLAIKALRLTPSLMQSCTDGTFSNEDLKKTGTSFDNMFEEVEIVIRGSLLTNIGVCEMEKTMSSKQQFGFLDLSLGNSLEKKLRCFMDYVDELGQDSNKFINYQRQCQRQQQQKAQALQKLDTENKSRIERGEAPLTTDDILKQFKPLQPMGRLDSLIVSSQITSFANQIDEFANQTFSKLYLGKSMLTKDEKVDE